MSQFNQSRTPQNLVINIVGEKIYLKNMSNQMLEIVKGMGASRVLAYKDKIIWLIECADEDELIKTLQELNRLGFLFEGDSSGYPPAEMFAFLLERKNLSIKFKEIRWRSPGDWYITER